MNFMLKQHARDKSTKDVNTTNNKQHQLFNIWKTFDHYHSTFQRTMLPERASWLVWELFKNQKNDVSKKNLSDLRCKPKILKNINHRHKS